MQEKGDIKRRRDLSINGPIIKGTHASNSSRLVRGGVRPVVRDMPHVSYGPYGAGPSPGAGRRPCSISEVLPRHTGIGRTVFEGTKVEEFRANILGVVENVIGTQRNLILARLEGGPIGFTRRHRRSDRPGKARST